MKRPFNAGHRGHEPKRRRAAVAPSEKSERPFVRHPLFGDIPLIPHAVTIAPGVEHTSRAYDPDYEPELPRGAIRGDVRKQEYCRMCHVPQYFFVDKPRTCAQCSQPFTFSAAEQKHWYEVLKFNFRSVATRCLSCRKKRRSERLLQQKLAEATRSARKSADDPAALLALARAIVRCFERTGEGPLPDAIAACRRSRGLLRRHCAHEIRETFFWEGLAHALAGRDSAARKTLTAFLDASPAGREHALLAKEARTWLTDHPS